MRIILVLVFCTFLYGQKHSTIETSEVTYLEMESEGSQSIFVDEKSLLVWTNLKKVPHFKSVIVARKYCQDLKLEDYSWHLPTHSELLSLSIPRLRPSMNPQIRSGRNKKYLAGDGPIWDNRLQYGFDYSKHSVMLFEKDSRDLRVRCVASLE